MIIKRSTTSLCRTIAIISLFFICGCEKAGNIVELKDENSSLLGAHVLKKNEVKEVKDADKKVTITLGEIYSSLCPKDVHCIWQGYATATISFKDEQAQVKTAKICLLGCAIVGIPTQGAVQLNGVDYIINFDEKEPFPLQTGNELNYVKINISKK